MSDSVEITQKEWQIEFNRVQSEKGELLKEGRTFKLLKKRFFTLCADSLIYYRDRAIQAKPRGSIKLINCQYELDMDRKKKAMIRVQGNCISSFQIWILAESQIQISFFLSFLSSAKIGKGIDNHLNEETFRVSLIQSDNQNDQDSVLEKMGMSKRDLLTERKFELLHSSSLHNNQSAIQNESDINDVNIMHNKHSRNTHNEDILKITSSQKESIQLCTKFQNSNLIPSLSPQKNSNLLFLHDSTRIALAPYTILAGKQDNCNVDTTEDVPNTGHMSYYEFYNHLENDHPQNCNQTTQRGSKSVKPSDRCSGIKYEEKRSKSNFKEHQKLLPSSASHLPPKSGRNKIKKQSGKVKGRKREQNNQKGVIDISEINGRCGNELTSSSIDYDEEKLYPTRKSLEEFEIEDICNDEIQHEKMSNQLMTKRSRKDSQQTNIKNQDQIISFQDYEDEDIEDVPPGLAKEVPLVSKKVDFVKNGMSQFENNSKCIDQYRRIRHEMNKQKNSSRAQIMISESRMSEYCHTEADQILGGSIYQENECMQGSKHLQHLKEMFKSQSIIANLQGGNIFHPNNEIDSDDEDIYDEDQEENDQKTKGSNNNSHKKIREVSAFLGDVQQVNAEIKLDNQIRAQASQLKLSDDQSQTQELCMMSEQSEDCLSLVSENNNIEQQLNSYQNNGCFTKNIFQSIKLLNCSNYLDGNYIYSLSKETIQNSKQYFIQTAINLQWSSRVNESRHIFDQLPQQESLIYSIECHLIQLLITGQIKYIESSIQSYQQIIQSLTNSKKDSQFHLSALENMIMLSEAHIGIGLLKILQDKKLSALSSINTAHNYLLQIQKIFDQQQKAAQKINTNIPKQQEEETINNNNNIKQPGKENKNIFSISNKNNNMGNNINNGNNNEKDNNGCSDEYKNRYLLIYGLFQIGMSLMPGFFSKIFSMLGINVDQKKGIASLNQCVEMNSIRSNFARIVLFLYSLEVETNILQAYSILKSSFQYHPVSPIFNWLASLYFWKLAQVRFFIQFCIGGLSLINFQSENAVKHMKIAIEQSEKYQHSPDFFKFELGWFYLSELQWDQAVTLFEKVIIRGFDFSSIAAKRIQKLCSDDEEMLKELNIIMNKYGKQDTQNQVKIMHISVIAFIIGVCFISSNHLQLNPQLKENGPQKKSNLISQNKPTKNGIQSHEDKLDVSVILDQSNKKIQINQQKVPIQNKYSLQEENQFKQDSGDKDNYKFKLWCYLSMEIYDKLGDSRTYLDIEFRKIVKLFEKRKHTQLIRYELLYFVKELSKVSDDNLDISLQQITYYQQHHLVQLEQNNNNIDSLIEVCSSYLLIIGISYILDKFSSILLFVKDERYIAHLSQLDNKHHYIHHHTFYWLGMAFKKYHLYKQALSFFELSKTTKPPIFNLSSRIEQNIADIKKILANS